MNDLIGYFGKGHIITHEQPVELKRQAQGRMPERKLVFDP